MSIKPLLLVWLGILGCVYGSMVGQNPCTWGPSYWCSHVAKAKECGAIEHCVSVWKRVRFTGNAKSCSVCESFVIGAMKLKENKISMEKIGYYMDTMCTHFKGVEVKKKCQHDVAEYIPELFKLQNLGMNAQDICHTLDFCQESRFAFDKNIEDLTTVETTATTTVRNNTICEDCKTFFNDVRKRITSSTVIKNIEKVFDDDVCPYLGPFASVCKQYVSDYVPIIMQQLSMYIAPEFLCSLLTFCPMSKEAAISHLMESIVHDNNLKGVCEDCEMFLDRVKAKLTSNVTTEELQEILDKEVCSHLGSYKEMCEMVVSSYADVVVADLVEKINSSEVCHDIGVCSSQILMKSVAEHFSKIKFSSVNPFREATECEMCKVLLKELHNVVEDKDVQVQITDFISNEVCSRLGDMKSSCLKLVMEYKPLIIKSIESLLDPVSGCSAVGMCTKQDSVVAQPSVIPMSPLMPALLVPFQRVGLVLPKKPKSNQECDLCKEVIGVMETFLKEQSTMEEIKTLLDKVCDLLPSSYANSCTTFINTYTEGILSLLIQELKPLVICESIKVCTGMANVAESNKIGCSYCTQIVDEAFSNLHIHPYMTGTEFKAYLHTLCQKDDQFIVICDSVVDRYSQTIYQAQRSGKSPKAACATLNLCPATALKPRTEHLFVVMCEIMKATGINTECKDLATISKEIHAGIKLPSKNPKFKSDALCYACTLVIGEVEKKLASKSTEEEIKRVVDAMCDKISPEIEKECDALMSYEEELIKLLEQNFPAKKVCQELLSCSSSHILSYKPKMFIV